MVCGTCVGLPVGAGHVQAAQLLEAVLQQERDLRYQGAGGRQNCVCVRECGCV